MDHIFESSVVEDFDDRPLKKVKWCPEPDFLESDRKLNGDSLSWLDLLELDRKINSYPLPSLLSPMIEFMFI